MPARMRVVSFCATFSSRTASALVSLSAVADAFGRLLAAAAAVAAKVAAAPFAAGALSAGAVVLSDAVAAADVAAELKVADVRAHAHAVSSGRQVDGAPVLAVVFH